MTEFGSAMMNTPIRPALAIVQVSVEFPSVEEVLTVQKWYMGYSVGRCGWDSRVVH